MKRYSFAAGLALAVVVVLGIAGAVAAGEQVPFKGSFEGDVSRGAVYFPYVDVLVEGTGDATQLGKFTFANPHTVHIPTRTGTYYIVAANGDTLTVDVTGQATPIPGTPSSTSRKLRPSPAVRAGSQARPGASPSSACTTRPPR